MERNKQIEELVEYALSKGLHPSDVDDAVYDGCASTSNNGVSNINNDGLYSQFDFLISTCAVQSFGLIEIRKSIDRFVETQEFTF